MTKTLINTFLIKILQWASDDEKKPERNWNELIGKIEEHIENHTIFLKPSNGPQIEYQSSKQLDADPEIEGISVAYYHENVKAPDTKAPALHMKNKLENILGEELLILLNREPESFTGYYVYIK